MEDSKIGWTDHTFNPWMGCTKVSPACDHCYAETLRVRVKGLDQDEWSTGTRTVTSDAYWRNPLRWDRKAAEAGRPALVFCASLADVFEARDDLDEPRARLWDLIEATPNLRWLLLTKRPENVLAMTPAGWHGAGFADQPGRLWPANVGVGTTVEDQERADERIPHLVRIPAPMRFLSYEPALGPLDLTRYLWRAMATSEIPGWALNDGCTEGRERTGAISWVIGGGESGPGHRPLDLDAVRAVRDQCAEAGVPWFFKQVGGRTPTAGGDLLDGVAHKEFPSW